MRITNLSLSTLVRGTEKGTGEAYFRVPTICGHRKLLPFLSLLILHQVWWQTRNAFSTSSFSHTWIILLQIERYQRDISYTKLSLIVFTLWLNQWRFCENVIFIAVPSKARTVRTSITPMPPTSAAEALICLSSEFSCRDNENCVPLVLVCDGVEDCPNGLDEKCGKLHRFLCLCPMVSTSIDGFSFSYAAQYFNLIICFPSHSWWL